MAPIGTSEDFKQGKEGLYSDIKAEDYHGSPKAINASTLKLMEISPKHFHYAWTTKGKDSDAKSLGRAVHAAVFEPERYSLMVVKPKYDLRTKSGKEDSAKWDEEHKGLEILKEDEKAEADTIREAVFSHEGARKLLESKSYNELTFVCKDENTGVLTRGRIDRYIKHGGVPAILDLKTTGNYATAKQFRKTCENFEYYFSQQFYRRGLLNIHKNVLKDKVTDIDCILIAVETVPPHGVAIFKLHKNWLVAAEHKIKEYLQLAKEGFDTGIWRGYSNDIQILDTSNYFNKENDL